MRCTGFVPATIAGVLLACLTVRARGADVPLEADFCEFTSAARAQAFGWNTEAVNGKPALEVSDDCQVGRSAVKARGRDFMGDWGTLVLLKDLDLSQAQKGDKIVFFIKQNAAAGIYVNIEGTYRSIPVARDAWARVELDMDPDEWTWPSGAQKWGRKKRFAFYAREFTSADHYLILDGLSFQIGGKHVPAGIPPDPAAPPDVRPEPARRGAPATFAPPPLPLLSEAWLKTAASKPLPVAEAQAWLLGNAEACWAVSRRSGGVLGGWFGPRRERCLNAVEGAYFLEDRQDLFKASENGDVVSDARLDAATQELRLVCANPALEGVGIVKTYRVAGGTLTREIRFESARDSLYFLSYRSEARLDPAFRKDGNYVGAGSFGPIESAAAITGEKQPMFYTNSRGILLSNPVRGVTLAHYRTKQDGTFLLPWWSYSRAESAKDCFYYTASGWKVPFGISPLQAGGAASYEENLTLLAGNYHDFAVRVYPANADVRKDFDSLSPVPAWLDDVVVMRFEGGAGGREYTDFTSVQRIAELTDEGHIIVMLGGWGPSWADYYVEDGLIGLHGGWITGPELREWIRKIKAISPRIKAGIYCYMDAANNESRLFKQHPEWFRGTDKEGNAVNHFAGTLSRTSMFNNPECRQAILAQYDRIFDYLGVDLVYLDDALTNNLVNWETNEVLRDADCYAFFRGIRDIAARHGPDKVVFFNGQGNPYGDINFIEAYTRLSADFWRPFAGVGLGVETFLINRPRARVTPLYWTAALDREYVNRVLALGWIPALEYTNDVDSRPFVSAAYEVGNTDPVNADYQPDWRKDKDLKIESYAVRRLGDPAVMLSFISYENNPVRRTVAVKIPTLGLDRDRPLFVWQYRVKDSTAYKGFTSEKLVKSVYAETGWTLDMVAAPECRYAGAYSDELRLDVDLAPQQLTMLVIGNDAAGVYSRDGLPLNFHFAAVRDVRLTARMDAARQGIAVEAASERDRCEIVAFVPQDRTVKSVTLDGADVPARWIALGDGLYPVVSVPRGRHVVRVVCDAQPPPALKLDAFTATVADSALTLSLPAGAAAAAKALVSVRQEGQTLFTGMVEKSGGGFRVPLAPRRGGRYEAALHAVLLPAGITRVACAPVAVSLPANLPALPLTPLSPGTEPEVKEVRDVNRRVLGLDVLRTGIHTTATSLPPFQTDLKALTVEVSPDTLTIDAGTTRKIQGSLGAAFGGFEVKNLRTVRVRLKNTYFGASHMNGPNIHTHLYYQTPRLFAGFIVDYHTAAGYTKRAALSLGVVHPDCNTPFPGYGKGGKPDQLADLGPILLEGAEKEFDLDLSPYAPEGWDGQVWFSVGSDWALPGRRLNAQILSANHALGDAVLRGSDPSAAKRAFQAAKREVRVPRTDAPPVLDGRLDDAAWKNAARAEDFFMIGGLRKPIADTTAYLLYDDQCLYVAFECEETRRKKPIAGKGDIWRDDEVEIYLDTADDRKGYRQVIINAGGDKLELVRPGGEKPIGVKVATSVEEGARWIVEAAIPFSGLGRTPSSGETWGLNLCRYHPEGTGFALEEITWAPTEQGFGDIARFGSLVFE